MSKNWIAICQDQDLVPGTGLCALVNDEQVAIFKMRKDNEIYAVSNFDPFGEANVLARGITGSIGDAVVVASPLYKQHFNLQTGECLEDESVSIKTYSVRQSGETIEIHAG